MSKEEKFCLKRASLELLSYILFPSLLNNVIKIILKKMNTLLYTWKSAHVHFLEVLCLEYNDGEFTRVWHITQREADVAQLKI